MKKILISVVAVLTMVAGVFWFVNNRSTTQKDSASTNQQLRVVTTNSILEDMVHNVGGDRIELYSIVKRGTTRTNMNRDRPTLLPLVKPMLSSTMASTLKLAEMVGSKS